MTLSAKTALDDNTGGNNAYISLVLCYSVAVTCFFVCMSVFVCLVAQRYTKLCRNVVLGTS